MPVETWKKLLPILLFIPAMTRGLEPRLFVSVGDALSNTGGQAVITAADNPLLAVIGMTADGCSPEFGTPEVTSGSIVWRGRSLATFAPCEDEPWLRQARLAPLPAGTYLVSVNLDNRSYASLTLVVKPSSTQPVFSFGSGRFTVGITFKHPATGAPTPAVMVPFSPVAATYWFFDPNNPEATVKILDGRPVNGHFWVFLSSMTTLDLTVHVSWCATVEGGPCTSKDYHSTPGKNLDVVDVTTFTGEAAP